MMKKSRIVWGMILMLSLLCMCACALAAVNVPFMPHGRVTLTPVSEALDYTAEYDAQNGTWDIVINMNAMSEDDWASVMLAGYRGSEIELFRFDCPREQWPEGASTVGTLNMSTNTEDGAYGFYLENLDMLTKYNGMGFPSVSLKNGYYNADAGVFLPQNITGRMYSGFGFRWKDGNGNDVRTEHALYTLTFSPFQDTIETSIPRAPQGSIAPDGAIPGTKADGHVRYAQQDDLAQNVTLRTLLTPPEGAAQARVNGQLLQKDENGSAVLETAVYAGDSAFEEGYIICWEDAQGAAKEAWRLMLTIRVGQPKPWPSYTPDLFTYENDGDNHTSVRIKPWGKAKGVLLDDSRYAAFGEMRLKGDALLLVAEAAAGVDITEGGMDVTITPPKDARFYRHYPNGAWNIYGADWMYNFHPGWNGNEETVAAKPVPNGKIHAQYGYLTQKEVPLANGGSMTYYYCDNLVGTFAGLVDIYFWYDEDMNRIGQNYMIHTFDDVPLLTAEPLLRSLDAAPDKKPFAVYMGTPGRFENVVLQANRHPSSPGTHYYDLQLIGPENEKVELNGEEVELYLPFPEGHSENSVRKLNITVGHYDEAHHLIATDVYTLENGKLEITPYGLKLKVKSFSPYVVSWEETASDMIPQTGDAFPLHAALMIMGLSLLGCAVLRKRMA